MGIMISCMPIGGMNIIKEIVSTVWYKGTVQNILLFQLDAQVEACYWYQHFVQCCCISRGSSSKISAVGQIVKGAARFLSCITFLMKYLIRTVLCPEVLYDNMYLKRTV